MPSPQQNTNFGKLNAIHTKKPSFGWLTINPHGWLYGKDGANVGTLDASAFSSLPNLNAAAQWRRLSECRRFIEAGFGEIDPWRNRMTGRCVEDHRFTRPGKLTDIAMENPHAFHG